jgi:fibrillarin-like pre-rRNA processing protein
MLDNDTGVTLNKSFLGYHPMVNSGVSMRVNPLGVSYFFAVIKDSVLPLCFISVLEYTVPIMKRIRNIDGLIIQDGRLYTENPVSCRGLRIYNERLLDLDGKEYRSWNPYRSKLAAALLKGLQNLKISKNDHVLYLGASTGTTVSHLSDILTNGVLYAVENSPVAMKDLINVASHRDNIIPILADANHPERYNAIIAHRVDMIYQDVSQRNQTDIFIQNIRWYLRDDGQGVLMVKARSIDVSLKPKQIYENVKQELGKNGLKIKEMTDLSPYERDHAAVVVSKQ